MAILKRNRLLNTSRVMREIWINKTISRVQIAKNLGLDKSTISSIVTELLNTGIIMEHAEGEAGPQGGRRPVYLTLNRSYGCVLGIELRPESYNAVAVDLEGNVLYSKFELIRLSGVNFKEIFFDVTKRMRAELARIAVPLLGIGVGVSGVVDPQKGVIRYSIPLQMEKEFDFREQIAADSDLPLFLENDANACAWGELAFHRIKNLQDFLFLLVEFRDIKDRERFHEKTAVGIGIVINGRVHYGTRYSAGEFRSIYCTPECKGQFSLTEEEAFRIEEDPEILHRFIRELAKNIAMLVNTFNLSHVFLGGDIERYKKEVQTVLSEEIERNWPYPDEVRCKIRFSTLGEKSVAFGAAGVVLHRLFADIGIGERVERFHPGGPTGVELIEQASPVGG
ncbi:MAG: ROK family transcriptional regulator [Spirochaetaceae bacterium]|nr:MAG: ROK family transcriptional regulator [Spirochaetaceae bacterium]